MSIVPKRLLEEDLLTTTAEEVAEVKVDVAEEVSVDTEEPVTEEPEVTEALEFDPFMI